MIDYHIQSERVVVSTMIQVSIYMKRDRPSSFGVALFPLWDTVVIILEPLEAQSSAGKPICRTMREMSLACDWEKICTPAGSRLYVYLPVADGVYSIIYGDDDDGFIIIIMSSSPFLLS